MICPKHGKPMYGDGERRFCSDCLREDQDIDGLARKSAENWVIKILVSIVVIILALLVLLIQAGIIQLPE